MTSRPTSGSLQALVREASRLYGQDQFESARAVAAQVGHDAAVAGDPIQEFFARIIEANSCLLLGQHEAALALLTRSLALVNELSAGGTALTPSLADDVVYAHMSWVQAALSIPAIPTEDLFAVIDAAERFARSAGSRGSDHSLSLERAYVLEHLGRHVEALPYAEEAVSLRLQGGDRGASLGSCRRELAVIYRELGRPDCAAAQLHAVLDEREVAAHDRLGATKQLAHLAIAAGDAAKARSLADQALALAEGLGPPYVAGALGTQVDVFRALGNASAARAAADRHLAVARALGVPSRLFCALQDVTDVLLDAGAFDEAAECLAEMEPLGRRLDIQSGHRARRKAIDRRLARLDEKQTTSAEGRIGH